MNQQKAIERAKELPWAKWVAADASGDWYAYEEKPSWNIDKYMVRGDIKWLQIGHEPPPRGVIAEINR